MLANSTYPDYTLCDILSGSLLLPMYLFMFLRSTKGESIMQLHISVAPITQLSTCVIKDSNIQGRSLNVVKVIFSLLSGTAQKGKKSLPLGANSFLKEKFPL